MIEELDGVGAFEGIYFAMHLDSRLRENDGDRMMNGFVIVDLNLGNDASARRGYGVLVGPTHLPG